jgi:Zn-dependent peptidase ImmA (M78 family)/DNA-binding transcriptional regulator YiaG
VLIDETEVQGDHHMSKRIPALVEPTVLIWARETSGYSIEDVAAKLKKEPEAIAAWESGERHPFMGQLRRLSEIYKRSISDFYLPVPPQEPPIPHDFRRAPGQVAFNYSPALRRQLRFARERRELALSLYAEADQYLPIPKDRISLDMDPEAIGGHIRKLLDIDFDEQMRWGDGRAAYNAWRRRIEIFGALVLQFVDVSPDEAWGFSIVEETLPVIGINRKLSPNGRTFTMLHEFTHVLLGEGSICDIDDFSPRDEAEWRVERFCNRVAAAALMPKVLFLRQNIVLKHERGLPYWDDSEITQLARVFGVSREATVRRLETFKLTTMEFYLSKCQQYQQEFAAMQRRERERSSGFRRNMPQEALSNLGRSYVSLVLQNYHEDRITLMDASQYLGVRAEKVRAVEELVFR